MKEQEGLVEGPLDGSSKPIDLLQKKEEGILVPRVQVLIDFYEEFPGHIEHAEPW